MRLWLDLAFIRKGWSLAYIYFHGWWFFSHCCNKTPQSTKETPMRELMRCFRSSQHFVFISQVLILTGFLGHIGSSFWILNLVNRNTASARPDMTSDASRWEVQAVSLPPSLKSVYHYNYSLTPKTLPIESRECLLLFGSCNTLTFVIVQILLWCITLTNDEPGFV